MRIAFWGVRGSTPTPARHTWRYGGNTPCLELRVADKLIVLDAGTGIREFGNRLLAEAAGQPLDLTLFFSHYHWDHIQGLPFFAPIYSPANTLHLYGPRFTDISTERPRPTLPWNTPSGRTFVFPSAIARCPGPSWPISTTSAAKSIA